MKLKYMKKLSLFLMILLIIPTITGCFFKDDTNAVSNEGLEIDYLIDRTKEDKEKELTKSLLSQAREKMLMDGKEEVEEIEIEDISSKEVNLSFWEKLKLKNAERSEVEETKTVFDQKNLLNEEAREEVKKNTFLEDHKKLKEEKKQEEQTKNDKKDNKEKDKKDLDKDQDKDKENEEQKPKENIVTISIRCDTAVAKGMHKEPKFAGIVPSSGVILSNTTVKIKDGDTVLNVLETIRDKYKIQMRYTGTKESAYIEGINNLYEFDGGRWSGWMYSVNSWYPNYGAGVYSLRAGDVIEWNYTCDLGKDLGQEWLLGN